MKAAVLEAWGKPLRIRIGSGPRVGTGAVFVNMDETNLPSYAAEIFNGSENMH